MLRTLLFIVSILPYPLRRDLRTNFYRYYFAAVYNIKNNNLSAAEEAAALAQNIAREKREAFLASYITGCIKAAKSSWSPARYYLENALNIADSKKDSILIEPWLLYVYYNDDGLYSTYELAKKFNSGIKDEKVFKALFLVDEERYDDALTVLKGMNNHEANYIKAYVYYKEGRSDSALVYLSKLDTLNDIEKMFYATLLYEDAEYRHAYSLIKGTPKSDVYTIVLQALIESKLESDRLIETYKKYRNLLKGKREFGKIALVTAGMYFKKRQYSRAVWVLEDAMPYLRGEERLRAMYYLGTSYVFLKRYANALKIWDDFLKNPDNHYDYAHFQAGRCAYELELDSIAKEHLLRIHDTSAYYFWGLYLTARGLLRQDIKSPALGLLSFIAQYPVERSLKRRVYYNLAKLLIENREFDTASVYLKKLTQLGFEGADIDSAEYLYEYCRLQEGKYQNPVELNLVFTSKYTKNPLVPALLNEVYTYYIARGKRDSALFVLMRLRRVAPESIYIKELSGFLSGLKDSVILKTVIDSVKDNGSDEERLVLANRLIKLGDGALAIDILEGVSNKNKRRALLLFARAYDVMGRVPERKLVLSEVFPPFDSIGDIAFEKLSSLTLKTEGMDSFYVLILNPDVPDTLRVNVLKRAIQELLDSGDTLNALELKSRLKEITGSDDSMEGN